MKGGRKIERKKDGKEERGKKWRIEGGKGSKEKNEGKKEADDVKRRKEPRKVGRGIFLPH